jgi:biotin transport system substrate-specific component
MTAQHPALPRRPVTLADRLVPGGIQRPRAALRAVALVIGGAALTAGAAQIAFTAPWSPVPYTGQTAAVLLVGTALGARLGIASMLLYVAAGSVGLPVYAGGAAGIDQLLGATGGYLLGFVLAAALVGRLAEHGWDRSVLRAAALMTAGNLVIYALGVPVLAATFAMPIGEAVSRGALVFLPWDAAKVVAASLALPFAWRAIGADRPRRPAPASDG